MSARLIRELALEALANRARLIELDRELQEMLHRHPDAALIRGLPGMGAVLTAEFIAEAGDLARFHFADALASAAGMAPVLRQSGRTRFRRRPNGGNKKSLKRVFYQSAFCSLAQNDSRTFYERNRRERKRHHQAVIALARRRINVLWAVVQSRTPFQTRFKSAT